MRASAVLALGALLLAGCTGDGEDLATASATDVSATDGTTATEGRSPSPTPTPAPTDTPPTFGAGTVTVDGTTVPVSGDCDISRGFGQQPVRGLGDDEVDVLLAVDNLTGTGEAVGPLAVRVRLLGSGAVEGRPITSISRGTDGQEVTWEGEVTTARLRDREQLEFLDVATLHLEAAQEPVGPGAPSGTRDLVVDVACAISRPG